MDKKEETKIKKYYKAFKEAWKDPRKKAGIKLLGYLIFFIVLILLSYISGDENSNYVSRFPETTTTKSNDNYYDKQSNLINQKHNIKYLITKDDKEFIINGFVIDGVVEGYLETSGTIKKVKIEDNKIYEIKNDSLNPIELDIDYSLLNIYNILELIKEKTSIIERDNDNKNYLYTVKSNNYDVNVKVYTDELEIYKIELIKDNDKYILNFED